MDINSNNFFHYLQFVQHYFLGTFSCHNFVLLLFHSCNKILLKFCFVLVILLLLFHDLNLRLGLPLFSFWFLKSHKFGFFVPIIICEGEIE
jgi:hypothetical protein